MKSSRLYRKIWSENDGSSKKKRTIKVKCDKRNNSNVSLTFFLSKEKRKLRNALTFKIQISTPTFSIKDKLNLCLVETRTWSWVFFLTCLFDSLHHLHSVAQRNLLLVWKERSFNCPLQTIPLRKRFCSLSLSRTKIFTQFLLLFYVFWQLFWVSGVICTKLYKKRPQKKAFKKKKTLFNSIFTESCLHI